MVRDRWYEGAHLHGHQALGDLRLVNGETLALLAGDAALGAFALEDLRFLDIEATGLGGAGAMVFLVAVGRWTAEGFLLRQYLAPSPPAEGPLLRALVADCRASGGACVLVTYNGATYDGPMLDARGVLHRLRTGFQQMEHVDLLKSVRRGLGDALRPHRLAHIESTLLGVVRDEDEVAGPDVPGWYFRFLRTGDARMLTPIVDHNADDVLSLAAMMARLATVLGETAPATGFEHLLVGRLYARAQQYEPALVHLDKARAAVASTTTRDLVALQMAAVLKRSGRRSDAVPLWEEVARGQVASAVAFIELAKHHEHQLRNFVGALEMVDRAIARQGTSAALLHRRNRLLRRLRSGAPSPTPATTIG